MARSVFQPKLYLGLIYFILFAIKVFHVSVQNQGYLLLVEGLERGDRQLVEDSLQWFKQDTGNSREQIGLSYAYYELGELVQAEHFYSASLEANGSAPIRLSLPSNATSYILQAIKEKNNEQFSAALGDIRQALITDPALDTNEFYQVYYELLALTGHTVPHHLTEFIQDGQLTTAIPQAALSPPLVIDQEENDCPQINSLEYDRQALELGPLVPIILTWQDKDSSWQEELVIHNLAPNAGFSWSSKEAIGYPQTIYTQDIISKTHQVEVDPTTGNHTALLVNDEMSYHTSYTTNPFPVDISKKFIQVVWFKGDEGSNPIIGYTRLGQALEDDLKHAFLETKKPHLEGNFVGRQTTMPPSAESAHITLINWDSQASVYFDNLLFFALNNPPCNN